jgi:hypothetical protein
MISCDNTNMGKDNFDTTHIGMKTGGCVLEDNLAIHLAILLLGIYLQIFTKI